MSDTDRPVRHAVAVAIRSPGRPGEILAVLRPPDDPDLPDAWGLPAASLRPGESHADAARRAGRDKLGVELVPGAELNRGRTERRDYTLEMSLLDATIAAGEPRVPQPHPDVTQYADWRWAPASILHDAARRGSLCSRLFLEAEGRG